MHINTNAAGHLRDLKQIQETCTNKTTIIPQKTPQTKPHKKSKTKPQKKFKTKQQTKPTTKPQTKPPTKPKTKPQTTPQTKPQTRASETRVGSLVMVLLLDNTSRDTETVR